jgi:hypothetical protein
MATKPVLAAAALAALAAAIAAPVASASPTVRGRVVDGALRVSGTPFADTFSLRVRASNPNQLQLDIGDDGSTDDTFDLSTFSSIDVRTGNGDDVVRLDTANGAFTTAKPTRVSGQNGDDTLLGGSGNETFYGGRGDDFADGNGGADSAFLGQGDDTFVWDPGDGSDRVEGRSGRDTHIFNGAAGAETFAATANGGRVRFARTPGGIVMDLNSVEVLDLRALGGADSVTVDDLTKTDLRRVVVDLASAIGGTAADNAADAVTVNGTADLDTIDVSANGDAVDVDGLPAFVRITHADPALDSLVVDGRDGDDAISVAAAAEQLIQVTAK